MVMFQIKQIEADLKRCIRGYVPDNLDKEYDIIQNNPYFLMKETFTTQITNELGEQYGGIF